jgi:hypothetical protein
MTILKSGDCSGCTTRFHSLPNMTHLPRRKDPKLLLHLRIHSQYLHNKYTLTCWDFFSEREQISIMKHEIPEVSIRHLAQETKGSALLCFWKKLQCMNVNFLWIRHFWHLLWSACALFFICWPTSFLIPLAVPVLMVWLHRWNNGLFLPRQIRYMQQARRQSHCIKIRCTPHIHTQQH